MFASAQSYTGNAIEISQVGRETGRIGMASGSMGGGGEGEGVGGSWQIWEGLPSLWGLSIQGLKESVS